ncbi:MAG TPA: hypothetical protein VE088_04095 [Gaiellaceae bacterium]|jgi:CBS domain containing-hemolysin-like protein|nr:hypothetical protein [Gaiellaceae bacterium]
MPAETLDPKERTRSEHVPASQELELEGEEELRAEAVAQLRRRRRFTVHAIVIGIVTPLVGLSWVLTEYYTAHTHHMWPSSFADAPADRPGVWSTWFFYFVGVMAIVLAIDAYKTYAKPYLNRRPTTTEVDREIARSRIRR